LQNCGKRLLTLSCLSVCLSCWPVCLSRRPVCLSVMLACLSVMSACLSICLSVCHVGLSVCHVGLSVCLSVMLACLSVTSACLSVCLSVRVSVSVEQLGSHWTDFHDMSAVHTASIFRVKVSLPVLFTFNCYTSLTPCCVTDLGRRSDFYGPPAGLGREVNGAVFTRTKSPGRSCY
jgi:hypothetical protein